MSGAARRDVYRGLSPLYDFRLVYLGVELNKLRKELRFLNGYILHPTLDGVNHMHKVIVCPRMTLLCRSMTF